MRSCPEALHPLPSRLSQLNRSSRTSPHSSSQGSNAKPSGGGANTVPAISASVQFSKRGRQCGLSTVIVRRSNRSEEVMMLLLCLLGRLKWKAWHHSSMADSIFFDSLCFWFLVHGTLARGISLICCRYVFCVLFVCCKHPCGCGSLFHFFTRGDFFCVLSCLALFHM